MKINSTTKIDLPKLISGKLLIQANSGGGKSWLIRRIVEQAYGKVQIIILDPEGEFSTLREKFDFVLAGKGGETSAHPKSAALLATRLLELKVSAIIDLYELHPQERKRFVRLFLESMVNAPKNLYHPTIIVLDEAHTFAPEKGEAESLGAVVGMASLGRKREFSLILATQRISKLHKDAAAECNNKLIGRASLDIDRKRAAEELGITNKEQILALRSLQPGEFFAFGPAISDEVIKIKVGEVQTSIPKGGSHYTVVPPTAGIKKILAKLADLPAEAEEEANTISELKGKIRNLEAEKRIVKLPAPATDLKAIEKSVKETEQRLHREFEMERRTYRKYLADVGAIFSKIKHLIPDALPAIQEIPVVKRLSIEEKPVVNVRPKIAQSEPIQREVTTDGSLSGPEQRILDAVAWLESIGVPEPEQTAVAFLAGYTYGGGGFNNPRSALRTKGFVDYRGNNIALTDAGRQMANVPDSILSTEELHRKVMDRLPGPERKLLSELLAVYPESLAKDELASRSGYASGSGGFNNPCSRLRTVGLVEYPQPGQVRARDILFLS